MGSDTNGTKWFLYPIPVGNSRNHVTLCQVKWMYMNAFNMRPKLFRAFFYY